MTLLNTAYLQLEDGDGTLATFEFRHEFEPSSSITKQFLMGGGGTGQYIREVFESDLNPVSIEAGRRRTGFYIDGGAGEWQEPFSFVTGLEDITWGDGSGGTGPSNVTKTDASGEGVKALRRKDVLQYWLARTRTDSLTPARLHTGEWTDGTLDDYRDGSYTSVDAGVYGMPMPVAVIEDEVSKSIESPSAVEGRITVTHIDASPEDIPDWFVDQIDRVEDKLGDVPDA